MKFVEFKSLLTVALIILCALVAHAQTVGEQDGSKKPPPPQPAGPTPAPAPVDTSFSYQGNLADSGMAADGTYDFQFRLLDSNGTQIGSTQNVDDVDVDAGLFNVSLNFGSVFNGLKLFLEVSVRPDGGGGYTILSPNAELKISPYAGNSSLVGGMRVVHGHVGSDGNVISGSPGIGSARDLSFTGAFNITFPAGAFSAPPTISLTAQNGFITPVLGIVHSVTSSGAALRFFTSYDAFGFYSEFHFIAIGPP